MVVALLPTSDTEDWLLLVEELLCDWLCCCFCFWLSVFVLLLMLLADPPVAVALAFPPVALLLEVLVALGGLVVAVGNTSQMKVRPLSTTTCPEPSPVPLPTVPVGT